jgi:hydroxypyruvate reductase
MAEARRPEWRELQIDLRALHAAALAAADPGLAVRRVLMPTSEGFRVGDESFALSRGARLVVIAAGKAAARMARAALAALEIHAPVGLVIEPHRGPEPPGPLAPWPASWVRLTASHPLPDQHSLDAGEAVSNLLSGLRREDVALVLLSGGASSLLERLRPGGTLEDLRRVTSALQRAGADVRQLNVVRRALSTLKGGGMARLAAPARVVTLAISDVVGDSPEAIASGPTVSSSTGPEEALRVLERRGVAAAAPQLVAVLAREAQQARPEEPAPGLFRIVASNRMATEAVCAAAVERGFRSQVTSGFLQGEAREVGLVVGGCGASVRTHGLPLAPPACLVFGGETTVTVRGRGRGGRNLELALGAARALDGVARCAVLSFATDGIDGSSAAAGAVATGETLARARSLGLSVDAALADNDSASFFRALGDLWEGGATGTNVNDISVTLVYP